MVAKYLHRYIKERHIPIIAICEKTGLKPSRVYPSIKENPTRTLKADELILICRFLNVDPMQIPNEAS